MGRNRLKNNSYNLRRLKLVTLLASHVDEFKDKQLGFCLGVRVWCYGSASCAL